MKTIEINKEVLDLVPSEFRNLPADVDYRLTKTESFRDGYVYAGDTVRNIYTKEEIDITDYESW